MNKILIVSVILILSLPSAKAQGMKLDEILGKYYKNAGFDKLQDAKTIIMTGTMTQQTIMPLKIIKKRPDKYMQEFDVQDQTGYQVYDGQMAWMTAPWTPDPRPQVMPEDRTVDLRSRADFDGPIYNWKAKGHKAELEGVDTLGNAKAYKIKLTRADAAIEYYFIDSESFLLIKKSSFRKMQGQDVEIENFFKDFRTINGIMFSFESENLMGGNPYSLIQYDTIEVDAEVSDKLFAMPE